MNSLVVLAYLLCISTAERTPQTQGHSLSCYKCYSEVSWEDCDKKQYAVHCIPGYGDEVCTTVKRTWWVKTNSSQHQKVSYSKNCNYAEGCTDEECREIGRQCTLSVKCCSSYLCNTSVIESANFIFIAAFLCLAL
ncbi:hypothetical protein OS493_003278 [Desmophyllum pertusum]|uniref:UPAR/Ly6 domain-containing protein n=1 Tax=Desmophyllum pertusum TaxID=174260 RepID=A0A9X0CH78_9CNID|nr:hypothetical protein OS493_003278 [Desmophyllum pertusum]